MNLDHIRALAATKCLKPEFVRSDVAVPGLARYEAFRGRHDKQHKRLITSASLLRGSNIDISWLPAAAETYCISSDPDDYVLVDVPAVTADIPNRNMQCFPLPELGYFDPMQGRQVYKTFIGRPTHIDHNNTDPTKAKGVILDAAMEYVPAYDVYKIRVLTAWDRTKDPHLAGQILSGERPGFSMGALASCFMCTICGELDTHITPCKHMSVHLGNHKGALWNISGDYRVSMSEVSNLAYSGMVTSEVLAAAENVRLVYQLLAGVAFVELSSVTAPADTSADISQAHNPIWMP